MKMRKTLSLCLAAGLAVSSSLVLAQGGPPPQGGMGGMGGMGGPPPGHQPGGPHGGPPGHGPKKGPHGGPPPQAQRGPGDDSGWQHPDWRKGDRVPQQYRDAQYRVDDYRQYHLDAPKRGHHWVGVGGDFLLVNGSGVIVQIVGGR
ncbi:RcnB family protein [Pandoraea sputorum]|uniref:RcnB family protein n=1 Tax=Pandoraea sputorum TaxID=93222 RepID=UPI001E509D63|nr:RcnB family protein [Pandoraea sputorum]MCE4059868.1 RcnB family protein [Pandoraea sputorum]